MPLEGYKVLIIFRFRKLEEKIIFSEFCQLIISNYRKRKINGPFSYLNQLICVHIDDHRKRIQRRGALEVMEVN